MTFMNDSLAQKGREEGWEGNPDFVGIFFCLILNLKPKKTQINTFFTQKIVLNKEEINV